MKKLIPIFLAVLCLTACGNEQVKNPDTLSTAVISSSDSVTAKNTLNSLNESTVATLTADKMCIRDRRYGDYEAQEYFLKLVK